ncbi:MAG: ABC transporter permease [Clostridiales bacterium]|nr:ABC transporter permease [Clostridiales bacterium]
MKAGLKTAFRLFKKHFARFTTIIAIVAVSIGFMSGIGEVENKIKIGARDLYEQSRVTDLYIKSSSPSGFTPQEIVTVCQRFGEENVKTGFCYETAKGENALRVYWLNVEDSLGKIELLEGELPTQEGEILAERETEGLTSCAVGDTVYIPNPMTGGETAYTVSGIVYNPLHIYNEDEPSFTKREDSQEDVLTLKEIYYFHTQTPPIINDIYVRVGNEAFGELFSNDYEENIAIVKAETETLLGDGATVLTLYENIGMYSLFSYAEKVGQIGIIFVVFFLLVTLLVVYSTMSRLFEEERAQIACQKTLGIADNRITGKYVWFVAVGSAIGGGIGFFIGLLLTSLLYNGFNMQYRMPPFPDSLNFYYYALTFGIILLANVVLAALCGKKATSSKPAQLLTPKAPKAGKKVILERIPFIWKALSFKYKSTVRNVLLFKSRFLMTVISVVGATVLVFAGLGLFNCAVNHGEAGSLIGISAVLIVFSGVLCALVIYNLTNINVSERTREIATLMVLGYHEREVTGYIYREVYIMCAIGAVLGVPLGMAFVNFVFDFISFGSLAEVEWWSYVLTPVMTMLFGFISTLLLRKKIVKTDMNASLKTIE